MTHLKTSILPLIVLANLATIASANEPVPMPHGAPPTGMGAGPGRHGMLMQRPGMRDGMMAEHKGYAQVILDHAEELKLTDEQLGKITRIHKENQALIADLGKRLHETMRETHEVFLNPASDEAAIRQKAQGHTSAFNEFLETALKSRNAVNAVLTQSQLAQLKTLK